jgi:hypothetical protein
MGVIQPLSKISIRRKKKAKFLEIKAQPVREAVKLTTIYEPIV